MYTYINMSTPGVQTLSTFLYQNDAQSAESLKNVTSLNYENVRDSNNMNYINGTIRYNADALCVSLQAGKRYALNQSYITIPVGVKIDCDANTCFGTYSAKTGTAPNEIPAKSAFDERFIYACSLKGYQHIIHNLRVSIGNVDVVLSQGMHNFYLNESLKSYSNEEAKIMGDITESYLDSHDSFQHDTLLLEKNNRTYLPAGDYVSSVNNGHIKRMKKSNKNLLKLKPAYTTFSQSCINNHRETGLIAVLDQNGDILDINGQINTVIKSLIFQWNVTIPLAKLHSFFANFPSVNALPSMTIDIETNMSRNNKYTVTYSYDAVKDTYSEKSVVVNQTAGQTCPFLLSQIITPDTEGIGLPVHRIGSSGDVAISLTPYIGYYSPTNINVGRITNITQFPQPTIGSEINLAVIGYTEALELQIASDMNSHLISYRQHVVDTSKEKRAGQSSFKERLNVTGTRLRKLYILPYLSDANSAASVLPYLSPVSSAPTTCSPCRLTDFNVLINGAVVYKSALRSVQEQYFSGNLMSMGKFNGNAFTSDLFSGQIDMEAFKTCYNAYVIDLELCDSIAADDMSKNINLEFKIDMDPTKLYNFVFVLETESLCNIERYTGMLVKAKST